MTFASVSAAFTSAMKRLYQAFTYRTALHMPEPAGAFVVAYLQRQLWDHR